MKRFNKFLVCSIVPFSTLFAFVSAVSIDAINKSKSNVFNISSNKPGKFYEKQMFSKNIEIKNYFANKDVNKVSVDNYLGKVQVELDSYQQSNKLWSSTPTNSISMNYDTVIRVNKNNNLLNFYNNNLSFKQVKNAFDNSATNSWSYHVSSWDAQAGQRYMGNVIIVPMWAPEVNTHHPAKVYYNWEGENIRHFIEKVANNLIDKVIPNMNFVYIYHFVKKLWKEYFKDIDFKLTFDIFSKKIKTFLLRTINDFKSRALKTEIKPNIISIDGIVDEKIKFNKVNFGNIKLRYYDAKNVAFKADHILPIIDYISEEKCSGPTCSHNIRHLVDVVVTSIKNLILDNFGNEETFIGKFITGITTNILNFILWIIVDFHDTLIPSFLVRELINEMYNVALKEGSIHDILPYINKNMGELLFALLGKVEKHGIQLGKCGNLISGIKINADDNHIKINKNQKFVIYGSDNIYNKIFTENGYNMNTIQCIIELKNYKDLYYYINSININENVKLKLFENINNISLPSSAIYTQFTNYLNFKINPKIYDEKLESFKKFESEEWVIPTFKNIDQWDLLCDYVLPDFFNNEFYYINNNGTKINFFNNLNFINNKHYNKQGELYFQSKNDVFEFTRGC